jgi:hypothetical protein
MPTPKKVTRTTVEKIEGTQDEKNPIISLIKRSLLDQEDIPELSEYQWKITVAKFARGGYSMMTGVVYNEVEGLTEKIGSEHGSGEYRLYVKCSDENGRQVAFLRLDNIRILDTNDSTGDLIEEADPQVQADQIALQMQRERFAHELRLKEMDQHNSVLIAAIQAKGGGGTSARDIIEAVQIGVTLAKGGSIQGGESEGGGLLDQIVKIVPMLQMLKAGGLPGMGPLPPAAPPQVPVQVVPPAQPPGPPVTDQSQEAGLLTSTNGRKTKKPATG